MLCMRDVQVWCPGVCWRSIKHLQVLSYKVYEEEKPFVDEL